jgi:hypothetical protein
MHFCTAKVAIAGDDQQVVHRNHYSPISWPEIEVLLVLHGDGAVGEIIPFVDVEFTAREERDRLDRIYGEDVVSKGDSNRAAVYPGRNPNMNMLAPSFTRAVGTRWKNPISGRMEIVTEDGSDVLPNTPLTRDSRQPTMVQMVSVPAQVSSPMEVVGDPRPATVEPPRSKGSRSQKYNDDSDTPFA